MAYEDIHLCPKYERAAELLGKRWTSKILRVLLEGPTSFSKIAKSVSKLSDRVPAERLKELEREGVVQRIVESSIPVKIEYSLTEKGHALQEVLEALQRWADRWESVESVEHELATTDC